ncbi:hypothetical protein GCM10011583_07210 [Streptomyces camponoticapitis]|uniref:Uncharacterized protein n=1 Tax=Streptomyces camponoticapitis TaxID=1616125 RepID=A0ABQ2DYI1_9ACTN|nr:hypothetical protein GCM10011583_07210 [Streptomyces camponoticapitis]
MTAVAEAPAPGAGSSEDGPLALLAADAPTTRVRTAGSTAQGARDLKVMPTPISSGDAKYERWWCEWWRYEPW